MTIQSKIPCDLTSVTVPLVFQQTFANEKCLRINVANPPQEAASPLAQTWSPVPPPGPDPRNPRAVQVGLK